MNIASLHVPSLLEPTLRRICDEYMEQVSGIELVKDIRLGIADRPTIIWTIISAIPFKDALRKPIYQAQLAVLRSLDENTEIDFRIVNTREIRGGEKALGLMLAESLVIWQRR